MKVSTRHHPDRDTADVYEELRGIFARLYERLEPEFAEISKPQWLV
jgi:hypothetical protein